MTKHKFVFVLLLCISHVLFSGLTVRPQDAEIERVVSEVSVDSQKDAFLSFTYQMKFSFKRHQFGGRKFSRVYEAILPSRVQANRLFKHRLLLIDDSERRITSAEIATARRELAEVLGKIEQEADQDAPQDKPETSGGYWTAGYSNNRMRVNVDVMKLLQNTQLSNLQRRTIDKRSIITLDFTPKANAPVDNNLAYLSKIEGQITIDEADKRIIRIEGYAPGEFAKLKDKTEDERLEALIFLFAQTKVVEGYWFPQTIRLNFAKHPEIFEPVEIQYNFSGYKRPSVDVKDVIESPKDKTETITEEKRN